LTNELNLRRLSRRPGRRSVECAGFADVTCPAWRPGEVALFINDARVYSGTYRRTGSSIGDGSVVDVPTQQVVASVLRHEQAAGFRERPPAEGSDADVPMWKALQRVADKLRGLARVTASVTLRAPGGTS